MSYAKDYGKALKFGRANHQDISSFMVGHNKDGPTDTNNTSDHIFADNLADAGDPRELLVRRDLKHRDKPAGDTSHTEEAFPGLKVRHSGQSAEIHEPEGMYTFYALHHPETGAVVGYDTAWHVKNDKGSMYTPTDDGWRGATYRASLTNDEVDKLLSGLDYEKTHHDLKKALRYR